MKLNSSSLNSKLNSNGPELTPAPVKTKFSVTFRDNSIAKRVSDCEKKPTTSISDRFKNIEEETSMDCDNENKKEPLRLNLLGCPLETNSNNRKSLEPFKDLNKHHDNLKSINPVFDRLKKLPLISNVKNINPYDLSIDETRDFSIEKRLIPWEHMLTINKHNKNEPLNQEVKRKLKIFEIINRDLEEKGTFSDRLAMDPRHNKSLMLSTSKYKDLCKDASKTNCETTSIQNKVKANIVFSFKTFCDYPFNYQKYYICQGE